MSSEQPRRASRAILTDAKKRVLLVKRGPGESEGRWGLHGGKPNKIAGSDQYESAEATMHRESIEELGHDFEFTKWGTSLSTNPNTGQMWKTVLFVAKMEIEVADIVLNHENTEARMFHMRELGGLAMAFEHGEILDIFNQSEGQRDTRYTSWLRVYRNDPEFLETG